MMRSFCVLLLLGFGIDYSELVQNLGAEQSVSVKSERRLIDAGKLAFPALLREIGNIEKLTNGRVFDTRIEQRPDGVWVLATPELGHVALLILRRQIEGTLPRVWRPHDHILTRDNVAEWIEKHEQLSLEQMQNCAAKEAVLNVVKKIAASDELTDIEVDKLDFFLRRYKKRSESFAADSSELPTH